MDDFVNIGGEDEAFVAEELLDHLQPTNVAEVEVTKSAHVDTTKHRSYNRQAEEMEGVESMEFEISELSLPRRRVQKDYSQPVRHVTGGRIKEKMEGLRIERAEKWQTKKMVSGGSPGKKGIQKAKGMSNQAGASTSPEEAHRPPCRRHITTHTSTTYSITRYTSTTYAITRYAKDTNSKHHKHVRSGRQGPWPRGVQRPLCWTDKN